MNTFFVFFKLPITVILLTSLLFALPLITGCESEEAKKEKQIQEQRERLLAPRKNKIDARNAKEFNPF